MKILVLKDRPLEYQTYPLYGEDVVTPLGKLVEVDNDLLASGTPLQFDGEKVVSDVEAKEREIVKAQRAEIERQIGEQKEYLRSTDYLLFKVMDNALTAEEYEPIRQRRAEAREIVNRLEEKLNSEGK